MFTGIFKSLRQVVIAGLVGLGSMGVFAQDQEAKLVSAPKFVLPQKAVDAGIEGTMTAGVRVGTGGSVEAAVILSGPVWPCSSAGDSAAEDLREAVRKNLREYKFSPKTVDGKPAEAELAVKFDIGQLAKEASGQAAADTAQTGPKAINGGVVNGKAKRLPIPGYPSAARVVRASGAVTIQVLIGEDGKILKAGAVSGHPTLQDAARSAACDARFGPTLLSGTPVRVSGVITYAFIP